MDLTDLTPEQRRQAYREIRESLTPEEYKQLESEAWQRKTREGIQRLSGKHTPTPSTPAQKDITKTYGKPSKGTRGGIKAAIQTFKFRK